MSNLISRQAAIDALKEEEYPCESDYDKGYMSALKKSVWIMEKWLPSAQPERKSGEWEEIEVIAGAYDISGVKTWASKMKCDQCGFTTIAVEGHFSQYNFCPNCGADMRGEQDG